MLVRECEDQTKELKFPFWVPRSESSTEVPILSAAPDKTERRYFGNFIRNITEVKDRALY